MASVALAMRAGDVTSRTSRRRVVTAAITEVARYLGNTPAVARRSYVDPRVIDRFDAGLTIADALALSTEASLPDGDGDGSGPATPVDESPVDERVRRAVLDLIAGDEDAADVERVATLAA